MLFKMQVPHPHHFLVGRVQVRRLLTCSCILIYYILMLDGTFSVYKNVIAK